MLHLNYITIYYFTEVCKTVMYCEYIVVQFSAVQ